MKIKDLKKIYLLPNVITAFGLSCGLFVIFKMTTLIGGPVDVETLQATAGILILAAFADLLDGAVARAMKAESYFGGLFDSLADAITFGVAPAIIVLRSLALPPSSELSFWLTISAMVFTVCGVLRLVRYSVMAQQQAEDAPVRKNFTGLPIPAAAAAIISSNLYLASDACGKFFPKCGELRAGILIVLMILVGYLMISRWKFPSLQTLQVRVASFRIVFLTVLAAVLIFYGFLYHFPVVFVTLTWGYIVTAFGLSLARLIAGRRAKALEDFEPEPDDLDV